MTVFEYLQAHPNTTSGEIAKGMNKKTPAVAMNEHDAINPTYRAMLEAAPQQEVKHG